MTCTSGVRVRERQCTPPQYGGFDCLGELKEEEPCDMGICPGGLLISSLLIDDKKTSNIIMLVY